MHRSRLLALLALPLVACGMKEDEFKKRYAEEACSLYVECQSEDDGSFILFEDEGECRAFMAIGMAYMGNGDGCEYDKKKAQECIEALEGADCSSAEAGPAACEEVYGADCESEMDTGA